MARRQQKEQMRKEELTEIETKMRFSLLSGYSATPAGLLACRPAFSSSPPCNYEGEN
jgi:hypothetical protein